MTQPGTPVVLGDSDHQDAARWADVDGHDGQNVIVLLSENYPGSADGILRYPELLTHALQTWTEPGSAAVVVVRTAGCDSGTAGVVDSITTGVVQSIQLEMGGRGVRVNAILADADQVGDIERTLAYFHGPDGGFVAGCSFDLRPHREGQER